MKEPVFVSGSLPLKKHRPTRFVAMNDVHVPHNIRLDVVFRFMRDYRPDYVMLVGDIMNMDWADHWAKGSAKRAKEMPEPKAYYQQCNREFYKPLRISAGDAATIVHHIGNHEYWAHRAIQAMPEGTGYWEPENNVQNVDYWVQPHGLVNLGKLHFMHGEAATGQHHAQRVLTLYRRNVRYGHRHDIQEASLTNPVDVTDRHTARSCGTLSTFDHEYMRGKPHAWCHAFTYGIVHPDGTFSDHTTQIIKGRFWANGKVYR